MPTAFVTGASSGIGEATAKHLAGLGLTVYAGARRLDRMEQELAPLGIRPIALDVTDDASMTAAVDRILAETGRIDALVNVAGYGSYGPLETVPLDEARHQFEVNVFGAARLIQLVLPSMRARGRGRIINMSSIAAKISEPMGAWYHATKYAIEGLSDSLRLELAPFGIKVVIIEPGLTKSEWIDTAMKKLIDTSAGTPYAEQGKRLANLYLEGDRLGVETSPDVVAKAIGRAIVRKNPRTRYAIGLAAKPVVAMRRLLPDAVIDPVMGSISRGTASEVGAGSSAPTARTALVTGASSGIGEATARRLAELGFTVYAGARRVERMAELESHGIRVLDLDVTDDASMTSAMDRILAETGRIDVLVNNAGYGSYGALEDVPLEEARRQFEVNVFGLARLIQLALPTMRAQGSGHIVNISSIGGKVYEAMGSWYHATKFAVEGLSDSLRLEVAPFGIRVVIIEPGAIRTEWSGIAADNAVERSSHTAYAKQAAQLASSYAATDRSRMVSGRGAVSGSGSGSASETGSGRGSEWGRGAESSSASASGWGSETGSGRGAESRSSSGRGAESGRGSGPEVVAKAIGRAATSKNPRARYAVGSMAKPAVWSRRVLPDAAMDAVLRTAASTR